MIRHPSRRRVVFLVILFFFLHFIATVYAVLQLSATLDRGGPVAGRFVPSFAVALSTLPLYPLLRGTMPFHTLALLNDGFCAIVAAYAVVHLRWRTIGAIVVATTILILGGVTVAAMWMEHRAHVLWRTLAPHAIDPVPRAVRLESSLGDFPIEPLSAWLAKEIARGDDRIDPLPQEVDHFLIMRRWEIQELRERLRSGVPPEPAEDPVPYSRIAKILLADALQTRSWRDLDAARRLTEAMLHQATPRSVPLCNRR